MSYIDRSSHSEVEQFAACERRHYYSYGMKIEGRTVSDALARGNVGHAALAEYYNLLMVGESQDAAEEAAYSVMHTEMRKYNVFDPDKLLLETSILLGLYFENYENEPIKVLNVETLYNVQLTSEFVMPIKLDLIAEIPPYGIIAMDHKFCNDFYSVDKVDLSPQLVKYWAALDALGMRVDAIWYNEIRYRNTNDNKADPSLRFRRTPVTMTPKKVVTIMREQMMAAKRITHLKSLPLVEWEQEIIRNPLHCQMCPFTLICAADIEGTDSDLVVRAFFDPKGVQMTVDPNYAAWHLPPNQIQVTTPKCPVCHERSVVMLTSDEYGLLMKGDQHVQAIFPKWTADRRELLITGTHPACWDKIFSQADVEDEDLD